MSTGNSLIKTKILDKVISKIENSTKSSQVSQTQESKQFILPPLEKSIYQKEISKPTSVLTRYLEDHTHNLLLETEEILNEPIKIKHKIKIGKITKENDEKKEDNFEVNDKKDENLQTEANNIRCITDGDINNLTKINRKLYLTEVKKIKNKSLPKDMAFNSISKIDTSMKKELSDNLFCYQKVKSNFPDFVKVDQQFPLEKIKKLDQRFRRLKTYQPKIYKDWKSKTGLTVSVGSLCSTSPMINDVEYQSRSFRDQVKLLEENIQHYKMSITSKKNYVESFCSLSIISKMEYNKALEETIGILLLLPQLILVDFYKFIQRFGNISIPKKEKFEEQYVFDEVENLFYNNNLLTEVLEFFKNCFEVYLLLINEVDEMNLKPENFNNIMSSFEKARYNICYVSNSSENALANYNRDLMSINKFNKNLGIKNDSVEQNVYEKMMNQFIFKKNSERQRKIRIDECLNYRKNEEENELIFTGKSHKNKKIKRIKFHSIIDSGLVTKLLKNCRVDAKNKINTERINNKIDGEFGEEGEILKNSKRKVIKLNF